MGRKNSGVHSFGNRRRHGARAEQPDFMHCQARIVISAVYNVKVRRELIGAVHRRLDHIPADFPVARHSPAPALVKISVALADGSASVNHTRHGAAVLIEDLPVKRDTHALRHRVISDENPYHSRFTLEEKRPLHFA